MCWQLMEDTLNSTFPNEIRPLMEECADVMTDNLITVCQQ